MANSFQLRYHVCLTFVALIQIPFDARVASFTEALVVVPWIAAIFSVWALHGCMTLVRHKIPRFLSQWDGGYALFYVVFFVLAAHASAFLRPEKLNESVTGLHFIRVIILTVIVGFGSSWHWLTAWLELECGNRVYSESLSLFASLLVLVFAGL